MNESLRSYHRATAHNYLLQYVDGSPINKQLAQGYPIAKILNFVGFLSEVLMILLPMLQPHNAIVDPENSRREFWFLGIFTTIRT